MVRRLIDLARDLHLDLLSAEGRLRRRLRPVPPDVERLNVLAHVPSYPPATNAGSEVSLHAALAQLAARGHKVEVIFRARGIPGSWDGVRVQREGSRRELHRLYEWTDVVLTQLEALARATRWSARHGRPLVHLLRMGGLGRRRGRWRPNLVVYNAEWLRAAERDQATRSLTLHPPVFADRYRTTPGDRITLVNFSFHKGAATFLALARSLPKDRFLAVRGNWGEQCTVPPDLTNVEVVENTPDMRAIYSRTRILLIPSVHEAYGRVGLEAAASGIPSIAHPSPGTLEALGDAARYADRNDTEAWVRHIETLNDPAEYRAASRRAHERLERHKPAREIDLFEQELRALVLEQRKCRS